MPEDNKLSPEEIDDIDLRAEDEETLFGDAGKVVETADDEKIPVSYEGAEEALLAMFIQDDDVATLIAQSGLRDIHFLKRKNRLMFPVILNVRFTKGVCNFDLVADALEKELLPDGQSVLEYVGGLKQLSEIITATPQVVDLKVAQSYVDIIFEQYKLSKVREAARWLVSQKKFDEMRLVDKVASIQQVLSDESIGKYGLVPIDVLLTDAYERYKDRKANPLKGIKVGFYWMEKHRAVAKKRTCVIGARTSVGKSVISSNMITNMLLDDNKVILFTPELDKEEYTDRLLCAEARLSIEDWKLGKITDAENARIGAARYKLAQKAHNLYIEDRGSQSCGYILNSIKKHMLNHQVDVVVVDYLQKLRYYGDNTKRAINDMMEKFCSFAKDNNIAFIILSQLRRSDKPEPELTDLKESGDIENFADSVILLHRQSITSHSERSKGWYKIAKNRQGGTTDPVELTFNEEYLKFTEDNIPQADVQSYNSLIEGAFEEEVADEDRTTEQTVAADVISKQGKV
ncbi:MAG: DnaB-like helicase C-terminal domain-containing protein [Bacilli bacterium]